MFIRKNRNRSGSTSVQIVSKEGGRYKVVRSVGSSKDPNEIEKFIIQAKRILGHPEGQLSLFPTRTPIELAVDSFLENISNDQIKVVGPELIFGELFDRIGFNDIAKDLFRHITIARLAYPVSKLKTVDYLKRYSGIEVSKNAIYRFLDELHSKHKEAVEKIAYEHTHRILKGISVVFYDMTTLYFEAEDEDDLRKIGYSKDGKFQHPQIMLGLLVGKGGYPIGYDIFEGNAFEGHTLIPILSKMKKKYAISTFTVVADSALLSRDNLEKLKDNKYHFIIGARIKNESTCLQAQILKLRSELSDGQSFEIKRPDGSRLIVSYSSKRAKKDAFNRDKGLQRLRKQIKTGQLTKDKINNRGYNKFLVLSGKTFVSIDENKVLKDALWDGLKGYITNTKLTTDSVIENYQNLWKIEEAFRISKTDLRIRPIFHYRKRRIEAHICISFVAYTIYKELERLLLNAQSSITVKRASELTRTMYQIQFKSSDTALPSKIILKMSPQQLEVYNLVKNSKF
ncbi:MAG: IS1634 family transposase [SAR324 cluster bacterium]|uniref:IS1634 family transposase n=1 Tax=SAR324 cluster bacterium TaxID=2024889 RepID=A0A7X9FP36_9DELT|nr:IS1634 family transposase [SAR324 cluster bacterium]